MEFLFIYFPNETFHPIYSFLLFDRGESESESVSLFSLLGRCRLRESGLLIVYNQKMKMRKHKTIDLPLSLSALFLLFFLQHFNLTVSKFTNQIFIIDVAANSSSFQHTHMMDERRFLPNNNNIMRMEFITTR